jgi:hypothetical protein
VVGSFIEGAVKVIEAGFKNFFDIVVEEVCLEDVSEQYMSGWAVGWLSTVRVLYYLYISYLQSSRLRTISSPATLSLSVGRMLLHCSMSRSGVFESLVLLRYCVICGRSISPSPT